MCAIEPRHKFELLVHKCANWQRSTKTHNAEVLFKTKPRLGAWRMNADACKKFWRLTERKLYSLGKPIRYAEQRATHNWFTPKQFARDVSSDFKLHLMGYDWPTHSRKQTLRSSYQSLIEKRCYILDNTSSIFFGLSINIVISTKTSFRKKFGGRP